MRERSTRPTHSHMETLANAIRLYQNGSLGRAEFFAQLDRMLAASPGGASALLDALGEGA